MGEIIVGLLGKHLSGKSSVASVLGTDMRLSEKFLYYLPELQSIIQNFKHCKSLSEINNLKAKLEGLLERDLHYKTIYLKLLDFKGINFRKPLRSDQIINYGMILEDLLREIKYEMASLSGQGSPTEEIRYLNNLKVKIFPGQLFEKSLSNVILLKDVLKFVDECEGRIVWVLSPSDLYEIVDFVLKNEETDMMNLIKLVEDNIGRNSTYFLITKVDNFVLMNNGKPKLTENIWQYRQRYFIFRENASIVTEEDIKSLLKNTFGEKYDENLAKTVLKYVKKTMDLWEQTYRALEVYSILYFTKYYLLKEIGDILYTSAEERRNVDEMVKFFKKVKGGRVIPKE